MTSYEQIKFVDELCEAVCNSITRDIADGRISENWDGIELRQFIAERYSRVVFKKTLTGKRKRDYNNTVLVNNL